MTKVHANIVLCLKKRGDFFTNVEILPNLATLIIIRLRRCIIRLNMIPKCSQIGQFCHNT
jgi:hypothetical protein